MAVPQCPFRLFLNAENLTNVRQTRWNPLLRPNRGADGPWTADAWSPFWKAVFSTVASGSRSKMFDISGQISALAKKTQSGLECLNRRTGDPHRPSAVWRPPP